jgi:predicted esterase
MRPRLAAALLVVVGTVLTSAPAATPRPSSQIVRIEDVGKGAAEAWVFLPAEERPDCVLTFIHDDGDLSPARYTPWLSYTVLRDHCAIVFPRYQLARHSSAAGNLRGLRAAVGAGMAFVRKTTFGLYGEKALASMPHIAAGFGSGGTLALALATQARSWGIPSPVAIDSVFPVVSDGAPVPDQQLDRRARVLVQVGDRDRVAGPASASAVRKYLASHPGGRARIQLVRSSASLAATHSAPLRVDTPSENAFWGPLDTLIDSVT